MRTLEVEGRRGDHRTAACGVVENDRRTGESLDAGDDRAPTEGPSLFRVAPLHGDAGSKAGSRPAAGERMSEGPFPSYVIFRCNRWGTYRRWVSQAGSSDAKPKHVRSWWGPVIQDRNTPQDWRDPRDVCPVDIPEAMETQSCIDALPKSLRDILLQEHVMRGTQAQKAHALGIDRVTFWRRCQRAYVILLGSFNDAGAGLPITEEKE